MCQVQIHTQPSTSIFNAAQLCMHILAAAAPESARHLVAMLVLELSSFQLTLTVRFQRYLLFRLILGAFVLCPAIVIETRTTGGCCDVE